MYLFGGQKIKNKPELEGVWVQLGASACHQGEVDFKSKF